MTMEITNLGDTFRIKLIEGDVSVMGTGHFKRPLLNRLKEDLMKKIELISMHR